MHALVVSPVRASAALVDKAWGTEIDVHCHYEAGSPPGVDYALVVVDKRDQRHPAGSWALDPRGVTEFTAGTALPRSSIAAIEITSEHRPILTLRLS